MRGEIAYRTISFQGNSKRSQAILMQNLGANYKAFKTRINFYLRLLHFISTFSFILMNAEPDEWNGIIKKVMEVDNSWNNTAGKYVELYHSIWWHAGDGASLMLVQWQSLLYGAMCLLKNRVHLFECVSPPSAWYWRIGRTQSSITTVNYLLISFHIHVSWRITFEFDSSCILLLT